MLFSRSLSLFSAICCSLHTKTKFSAHSSTQCTHQVNQTYKIHSYHVLDSTWQFCAPSNYVVYPQFQLNRRIFNDFFSGFALSLYEIFRLKQFQKFIYCSNYLFLKNLELKCDWKFRYMLPVMFNVEFSSHLETWSRFHWPNWNFSRFLATWVSCQLS